MFLWLQADGKHVDSLDGKGHFWAKSGNSASSCMDVVLNLITKLPLVATQCPPVARCGGIPDLQATAPTRLVLLELADILPKLQGYVLMGRHGSQTRTKCTGNPSSLRACIVPGIPKP